MILPDSLSLSADSFSLAADSPGLSADSLVAVGDSLVARVDSACAVADSIGLPEAENPAGLELVSLDDCSFFSGDSLFRAEVSGRKFGFGAVETPFRPRHDAWSGLLIFFCFLLASSLVVRIKKKFGELFREVFLPIPGKTDVPLVDDPLRYSTRLVAVGLISLSAAMATFAFTQRDVAYYPFPETPYLLFVAFVMLWIGYFVAKRWMENFVNWVFFRQEKTLTWERSFTFIYVLESMLFLAFSLVMVYLPISHEEGLFLAICSVVIVKILQLFKTYQIFFPKMYGTLHLIVYFCTLELMPLLALQQVLAFADRLSVIRI